MAGGAGEDAVEDQERGPAAGDHHDRAVGTGHVEVAALRAGEEERDHARGDEEDGGLDERDVAEGGDRVRVDGAALAVQRLEVIPGEEHRDEQRDRGDRGDALLGRKRPPGARDTRHAPALGALCGMGRLYGVVQREPRGSPLPGPKHTHRPTWRCAVSAADTAQMTLFLPVKKIFAGGLTFDVAQV